MCRAVRRLGWLRAISSWAVLKFSCWLGVVEPNGAECQLSQTSGGGLAPWCPSYYGVCEHTRRCYLIVFVCYDVLDF